MDGFGGLGTPRNIPLICTVCPDSPRFSDVSHLLTHIASKGHLHHETQTKLRAHQDLVAAVALQQYEQWYHENGIETLLVERLKAKQVKEAMKGRLHRANVANKPSNPAPRVSHQTLHNEIFSNLITRAKNEQDGRPTNRTSTLHKTLHNPFRYTLVYMQRETMQNYQMRCGKITRCYHSKVRYGQAWGRWT